MFSFIPGSFGYFSKYKSADTRDTEAITHQCSCFSDDDQGEPDPAVWEEPCRPQVAKEEYVWFE